MSSVILLRGIASLRPKAESIACGWLAGVAVICSAAVVEHVAKIQFPHTCPSMRDKEVADAT